MSVTTRTRHASTAEALSRQPSPRRHVMRRVRLAALAQQRGDAQVLQPVRNLGELALEVGLFRIEARDERRAAGDERERRVPRARGPLRRGAVSTWWTRTRTPRRTLRSVPPELNID